MRLKTKAKPMKLLTFEEHKRRLLKDPAFRKAYEEPDEDIFFETAYRLMMARSERGLTQAQLAKKVGVSQQAVARLESLNYKGHSLAAIQRMASALGMRLKLEFVKERK